VELVGGRDALWNLTFELNVARLNLLGDQLEPDTDVEWNVSRYDLATKTVVPVVRYFASVVANEEDSSKLLVRDAVGGFEQGPMRWRVFPVGVARGLGWIRLRS